MVRKRFLNIFLMTIINPGHIKHYLFINVTEDYTELDNMKTLRLQKI
jgi:hypothetical protein